MDERKEREVRKPTIAQLQSDLAEYREIAARQPATQRILSALVPAAYDQCQRFADFDIDDSTRLVVYGFESRYGYDLLIAQLGTGAGEGVLNVEGLTADDFSDRMMKIPNDGSALVHAYGNAAERARTWMRHHPHFGSDHYDEQESCCRKPV